MRRAVIKVQDKPIALTSELKDSIQELCGKTITVNIADNGDVYAESNPKLAIYGEGCILLWKEYEIIVEK